MAEGKKRTTRGDLDVYFKSKHFLKRLDEIRAISNDPTDLKAYAFNIVYKMKLLNIHAGVIAHYLQTGEYDPLATSRSSIQIIDKGQQIIPGTKNPRQTYKWAAPTLDIGVYIELDGNMSQEELVSFIEDKNNWTLIKESLDANYKGRKKRFAPVRRIDDYLAIADIMNAITKGAEKSDKAAELAVHYRGLDISDIYKLAKKYKSILVE